MRRARLLLVLLAFGCSDPPDRTPCEQSSECPVIDCGSGVTVQYCNRNWCEEDVDAACEHASTVASSSGTGAGQGGEGGGS